MEFRSDSFLFLPLRGRGPQPANKTYVFPRQVRAAVTGIAGYVAEFSNRDDHHLGSIDVRVETEILGNTVTVNGFFGLRDWSGEWDDEYDGIIEFTVVAELVPATQPPPRADLVITGAELNQSVQHFRSSRYLDPQNARPDNSIFLIAGKNTGVRIYADWDKTAGLPPINRLTGQLVVRTASTSVTLEPINPGKGIVPKRDAAINQAVADDTLNFMIPASLAAGVVTVSCEVFDENAPGSRSAAFSRTLSFVPTEPLNIFLVGVATKQPPAPAPTQAQIMASLSLVNSTYPRNITATGFTTITVDGDFTGPPSTLSCGGGWDKAKDAVGDLRGGSGDVYYGGVPAGIVCVAIVGGCSPVGSGVAVAFTDVPPGVAHEIGHALGRNHAPCRGCPNSPSSPDNDYPTYNGFPPDSIGVFGFDPTTNTVVNPASTLDFMSGRLGVGCTAGTVSSVTPRWISPYTYQGLLGQRLGATAGALTLLDRPQMTLFLGLTIPRDRKVVRRHSFHYQAPPQGSSGCASAFTYELLDGERQVLDCGPLHCGCTGSDCHCWPKIIRDAIVMPAGARLLKVWEGEKEIYEEKIPDPPKVRITGRDVDQQGIHLRWESEPGRGLWYVVHWKDVRSGEYRGVAPRQEEKKLLIPRRLFASGAELRVRVYATSGIATGFVEEVLKLEDTHLPSAQLTLVGATSAEGPQHLPAVLTAIATDSAGGQDEGDRIAWYDGAGSQLARGRHLDTRTLPPGRHVVRAVGRGLGAILRKSWLIERTADGITLHHAICDPPPRRSHEEHHHPHPKPPKCEN
jgi:hypothetical protein